MYIKMEDCDNERAQITEIKQESTFEEVEDTTCYETYDMKIKSEDENLDWEKVSCKSPSEIKVEENVNEPTILVHKSNIKERTNDSKKEGERRTYKVTFAEGKMHKCEICAYEAKSKGNLKSHALIHKGASEVTMYKCRKCSYRSKRKCHLKRHLLVHVRGRNAQAWDNNVDMR